MTNGIERQAESKPSSDLGIVVQDVVAHDAQTSLAIGVTSSDALKTIGRATDLYQSTMLPSRKRLPCGDAAENFQMTSQDAELSPPKKRRLGRKKRVTIEEEPEDLGDSSSDPVLKKVRVKQLPRYSWRVGKIRKKANGAGPQLLATLPRTKLGWQSRLIGLDKALQRHKAEQGVGLGTGDDADQPAGVDVLNEIVVAAVARAEDVPEDAPTVVAPLCKPRRRAGSDASSSHGSLFAAVQSAAVDHAINVVAEVIPVSPTEPADIPAKPVESHCEIFDSDSAESQVRAESESSKPGELEAAMAGAEAAQDSSDCDSAESQVCGAPGTAEPGELDAAIAGDVSPSQHALSGDTDFVENSVVDVVDDSLATFPTKPTDALGKPAKSDPVIPCDPDMQLLASEGARSEVREEFARFAMLEKLDTAIAGADSASGGCVSLSTHAVSGSIDSLLPIAKVPSADVVVIAQQGLQIGSAVQDSNDGSSSGDISMEDVSMAASDSGDEQDDAVGEPL